MRGQIILYIQTQIQKYIRTTIYVYIYMYVSQKSGIQHHQKENQETSCTKTNANLTTQKSKINSQPKNAGEGIPFTTTPLAPATPPSTLRHRRNATRPSYPFLYR